MPPDLYNLHTRNHSELSALPSISDLPAWMNQLPRVPGPPGRTEFGFEMSERRALDEDEGGLSINNRRGMI